MAYKIFTFINWQRIRNLGELQILTRVSYITLVLVPILAALWPSVILIVSQYNKAVTDSRTVLELTTEKLKNEAKNIDQYLNDNTITSNEVISKEVKLIIEDFENQLNLIKNGYSLNKINELAMPSIWAKAFLASLYVLIAHLIYQIIAPEIVRKSTLQNYGISRRNLQAENPSEGNIRRACEYLTITKNWYHSGVDQNDRPTDPDEEQKWGLDIAEKGAYAEYKYYSRKQPFWAWVSGLLYFFAIVIIFDISFHQTLSVLKMAKYIN